MRKCSCRWTSSLIVQKWIYLDLVSLNFGLNNEWCHWKRTFLVQKLNQLIFTWFFWNQFISRDRSKVIARGCYVRTRVDASKVYPIFAGRRKCLSYYSILPAWIVHIISTIFKLRKDKLNTPIQIWFLWNI